MTVSLNLLFCIVRMRFKAEYYGATKTCQPYKGATGNQELRAAAAFTQQGT